MQGEFSSTSVDGGNDAITGAAFLHRVHKIVHNADPRPRRCLCIDPLMGNQFNTLVFGLYVQQQARGFGRRRQTIG